MNQPPSHRLLRLTSAAVLFAASALSGCGSDGATGSQCANPSISVAPESLVLLQGRSAQLSAQVSCGSSSSATTPTFSSGDTTTATVSSQGLVDSRRGGRTLVSVAAFGVTRNVPVAVFGHPAGILALTQPLGGVPVGVAISDSGTVFVTRYDSASLGRYSLPTFAASPGPAVPTTGLDVSFTGDGNHAFVTNRDQQQVTSINLLLNASDGYTPVGGHPLRVLVQRAMGVVLVTTDQDSLYKIDAFTRGILSRIFLPSGASGSGPNGLVLSPDGSLLYVSRQVGGALKIQVSSLTILDTIPIGPADGIAISPSGDTLYSPQGGPAGLYLWDQNTHAYLTYRSLPQRPYDVKLSPDSAQLYVTTDSLLFVLDRATLQWTDTVHLAVGTGLLRRIAFDKYGRFAVVASEGGAVHFIK